MQKLSEYRFEDTVCLRGGIKAFYIRAINRRSELVVTHILFHIMHIIFCLFITPLYLGYISHFMGFIIHKNKKRIIEELSSNKLLLYFWYSFIRGLLMFPYIILFFPFMVILLLPGIFSYKYYLYIFVMYIDGVWNGSGPLTNVGKYSW